MRTCSKCKTEKSELEFYPYSPSWCMACCRESAREYRARNSEQVKAYDRLRGLTRKRKKLVKAYSHTERGAERRAAAAKAWVLRNPEKRKAQVAVSNAIRDGKLVRQPCEDCGKAKSQAHHDDYTKPFEIRWKCARCHARHHRNERGH